MVGSGSGSVSKVEPAAAADSSGLGRERSPGCVQRWSGLEGLGQDLGVGGSANCGPWEFEMPIC